MPLAPDFPSMRRLSGRAPGTAHQLAPESARFILLAMLTDYVPECRPHG